MSDNSADLSERLIDELLAFTRHSQRADSLLREVTRQLDLAAEHRGRALTLLGVLKLRGAEQTGASARIIQEAEQVSWSAQKRYKK